MDSTTNGHSTSHQIGYAEFPHLAQDAIHDGKPALNRYSTFITREHDFPAAKVIT